MSQVSIVQGLASSQSSSVPAAQVPPWQVSRPLHALLSAHAVPFATGVCWQPLSGLHASTVHGFASSQRSGVPAVQVPPWQVSAPLHTVASAHDVPFATGGLSHAPPLHTSAVHGLASAQSVSTVQVR